MKFTKIRAFSLGILVIGGVLSSAVVQGNQAEIMYGRSEWASFQYPEGGTATGVFFDSMKAYLAYDRNTQWAEGNDMQLIMTAFGKMFSPDKDKIRVEVYLPLETTSEFRVGLEANGGIFEKDHYALPALGFEQVFKDSGVSEKAIKRIRFRCPEVLFTPNFIGQSFYKKEYDQIVLQDGDWFGKNKDGEDLYDQTGKQIASYRPERKVIFISDNVLCQEMIKRISFDADIAWRQYDPRNAWGMTGDEKEEKFKEPTMKARELLKMIEEKPERSLEFSFKLDAISPEKMREAMKAYKEKKGKVKFSKRLL